MVEELSNLWRSRLLLFVIVSLWGLGIQCCVCYVLLGLSERTYM